MSHIHKYTTTRLGKRIIAKCDDASCTHYTELILANGKLSRCNYCDNKFNLTKKLLKLRKPHCGCQWSAVNKARSIAAEIDEALDNLGV